MIKTRNYEEISMLKSRKNNIVWTLWEDYSKTPHLIFDKEDDDSFVFYRYMLIGEAYKHINIYELAGYIYNITENTDHVDTFYKVCELALDMCFKDRLIKSRPQAKIIRDEFIEDNISRLSSKKFTDLTAEEEIEYAYYLSQKNETLYFRDVVRKIIIKLRSLEGVHDYDRIIFTLSEIFGKYFYINLNFRNEQNDPLKENVISEDDKIKVENKKKSRNQRVKSEDELEINEVFSADFSTANLIVQEKDKDDTKGEMEKNVEKAIVFDDIDDSVFKIINETYGIMDGRFKLFQNSINYDLKGIHEGCKVFFSSGVHPKTPNGNYFSKVKEEQRNKNIEYFEYNSAKFQREISKLKTVITKYILEDMDISKKVKTYGTIDASRIWRAKAVGDNKVFNKYQRDEVGKLYVDILLDSSASQSDRLEKISSQAFIIASAFRELNLPVRVVGYRSLFNYTVINIFRDYNDELIKNWDVFNLVGSGSNRDGLAYRTLYNIINKDTKANRLVIILSDAKPNNSAKLNKIMPQSTETKPYTGKEAIEDAAKEVFNYKLNNISVLGIFTGNKEDIDAEKYIFGSDFVYINNIDRFSTVVGNYIKDKLSR